MMQCHRVSQANLWPVPRELSDTVLARGEES